MIIIVVYVFLCFFSCFSQDATHWPVCVDVGGQLNILITKETADIFGALQNRESKKMSTMCTEYVSIAKDFCDRNHVKPSHFLKLLRLYASSEQQQSPENEIDESEWDTIWQLNTYLVGDETAFREGITKDTNAINYLYTCMYDRNKSLLWKQVEDASPEKKQKRIKEWKENDPYRVCFGAVFQNYTSCKDTAIESTKDILFNKQFESIHDVDVYGKNIFNEKDSTLLLINQPTLEFYHFPLIEQLHTKSPKNYYIQLDMNYMHDSDIRSLCLPGNFIRFQESNVDLPMIKNVIDKQSEESVLMFHSMKLPSGTLRLIKENGYEKVMVNPVEKRVLFIKKPQLLPIISKYVGHTGIAIALGVLAESVIRTLALPISSGTAYLGSAFSYFAYASYIFFFDLVNARIKGINFIECNEKDTELSTLYDQWKH